MIFLLQSRQKALQDLEQMQNVHVSLLAYYCLCYFSVGHGLQIIGYVMHVLDIDMLCEILCYFFLKKWDMLEMIGPYNNVEISVTRTHLCLWVYDPLFFICTSNLHFDCWWKYLVKILLDALFFHEIYGVKKCWTLKFWMVLNSLWFVGKEPWFTYEFW